MLVRVQGGYVNLATISEAELHDDGGVTLYWGTRHRRCEGFDATTVRKGLETLTGKAPPTSDPPHRGTQAQAMAMELPREPAPSREEKENGGGPAILQLRAAPSPAADLDHDDAKENLLDDEEDDGEKAESALSRRADLVKSFEPIASLSHKHRGAFLAAIEKAADFNHLPPKYRRMIQDAEAQRRAQLRR